MRAVLNTKLLSQSFAYHHEADQVLQQAKAIADVYAKLENGMSILSDMKNRKSYIFYGALSDQLGISSRIPEINSIWEDELLDRVHPDDLQRKYRMEFQFFRLLKTLDPEQRSHYELITKLRIRDQYGRYQAIKHRLLYISSALDGSISLALCLYHTLFDHPEFNVPEAAILNHQTGKVIESDDTPFSRLLSEREKEIMKLIISGLRSKEIAGQLSLSINTVNRHRQNIFQKLHVTNVMEACRVAKNTLQL